MKKLIIAVMFLSSFIFGQTYQLESFSEALGKYFEQKKPYYGVEWNWLTDSYTRLGSLTEFAVSTSPGNVNLPIQSKMRRCILNDAGQVQYYLDPNNSILTENGDTAKLDGTDGQVMVEIPQFYYNLEFGANSVKIMVSEDSLSGWRRMDKRYVGAYPASLYDSSAAAYVTNGDNAMYASGDILASISGAYVKVNETRAEFRAAATKRGVGWHQLGYEDYFAIQLMFVTEYADFNIQDVIGEGNTKWASFNYDLNISTTGKSNADGNGTNNQSTVGGAITDYVTYRGIEDVFGNTWQFLDGANVNNDGVSSKLWVNSSYGTWADNTETNYTYVGALAQLDGYITNLVRTNLFFAPADVGGSSSIYLADYYYTYYDDNPSSGWRVLLVGGYAYNGVAAGVFNVYSLNGSSLAGSNLGGRLCFFGGN
jgi:hypothetical protein